MKTQWISLWEPILIYLYDAYEKVTVNEMNKLKPGLALNLYDVLTNAAQTH